MGSPGRPGNQWRHPPQILKKASLLAGLSRESLRSATVKREPVRVCGVILGVATLLWGFLQAPFDHIHPGEDFEHEAMSTPVHLHEHEKFLGPSVEVYAPAEDDEIDVLWNAATSANVVLHADFELAERVTVPTPSVLSAAILVPRHRGHDPPESSPKIPRAPPA